MLKISVLIKILDFITFLAGDPPSSGGSRLPTAAELTVIKCNS